MLDIIPAIDLRGGKAVRLQRGDFGKEERVAEDPVAMAEAFAEQGATRLHVVDLDGAKTGTAQNGLVVTAILKAVPRLRVQVGGGIRSVETAARLIDLGADRLVVGTSAARDEPTIRALLEQFADRLVIGADASEGFIAVQGWLERTGEGAETFGRRLVALGARRFLFTDIARDGMLQGANIEATRSFARAVGVPVLASGGVSSRNDIERLAEAQPDGVEGVIIGKALYSGRLTLADALKAAG